MRSGRCFVEASQVSQQTVVPVEDRQGRHDQQGPAWKATQRRRVDLQLCAFSYGRHVYGKFASSCRSHRFYPILPIWTPYRSYTRVKPGLDHLLLGMVWEEDRVAPLHGRPQVGPGW
ncbi:hypothetical protein M2194_003399 [Bradyrhizobium elkanii]|nr:hypothetical protein [Bradyrhizobium elkanii]